MARTSLPPREEAQLIASRYRLTWIFEHVDRVAFRQVADEMDAVDKAVTALWRKLRPEIDDG